MNQKSKGKSDPSSRRQDYTRVVAALKRLGFPQDATDTIWKVLASVLHLGNLQFEAKVRFLMMNRLLTIIYRRMRGPK